MASSKWPSRTSRESKLLLSLFAAGTVSGCFASGRTDNSTEIYRTFLATHFADENLHEIYLLDRTTEETPTAVLRECPEASGFNPPAVFSHTTEPLDRSLDGFGRYRLVDETESKAVLQRHHNVNDSPFDYSKNPPAEPDENGLIELPVSGVVYLSQVLFNDDNTRAVVSYGFYQWWGVGFGGAAMFERNQGGWKHSRNCGGWVT